MTDRDGLVDLVELGSDLTATLFGIVLGCRVPRRVASVTGSEMTQEGKGKA